MTEIKQIGTVEEVGETVCLVRGLPHVTMEEEVIFESGTHGTVLRLDEDYIHAVVLGDARSVKRGDSVVGTGMALSAPVGEELRGRVVNPLGVPVDGKGNFQNVQKWPIERKAPSIFMRKPIKEQLETGLIQMDGMLPIGKGQRATIIGDPKSGKSSALYTAMINLARVGVITVYVTIGKTQSQVKQLVKKLEEEGVLNNVVIVMATAAMSPTLNYIAPYVGCTIAEFFMEKGEHTLAIYDDLSQHAKSYRQMSLLLKRPPGREAYPGDIFYIHSRLLERAAQLDDAHGGGSMAALPVIEALERDLSGYVATNVLSITDGHILFDMTMYNKGIMPSIAIELSVSRLGGKVQCDILKRLGVKISRMLMQYREAQAFASFGTDLTDDTKLRIKRGERIYEFLKQKVYEAIKLENQIMLFYGLTEGAFDNLVLETCGEARAAFLEFTNRSAFKDLRTDIMTRKMDEMKPQLDDFMIKAREVIEPYEEGSKSVPKPSEKKTSTEENPPKDKEEGSDSSSKPAAENASASDDKKAADRKEDTPAPKKKSFFSFLFFWRKSKKKTTDKPAKPEEIKPDNTEKKPEESKPEEVKTETPPETTPDKEGDPKQEPPTTTKAGNAS